MPGDVNSLDLDVVVYVDGACKNNGQADSRGGCGVFWGENHDLNCSEPLLGDKQTNNRAEMSAAVIALSQAIDRKITKLTIVSDSRYLKEGISNWINTWKLNGWKSDKKTGILNKDLWLLLDGLRNKLEVAWRWVEGHSTSEGNNRADTLAGVGVSESSCFWQQRALEIVSVPTQAPEPSAQSKLEEVNKVCSFCYEVSSEKTILCTDCRSACHYSCTRLPRYQLYAFANRHRKYSCEKCMTVPISFASNIEDEVTVGNTSLTETPCVDKSKETSACPGKLEDVLAQHTKNIQKQFDTFQSNTVHSLEISFVNAIEKLSVVQSAHSNNDQQNQINQLLQDKDNLMREKDNLLKQRRNGPLGENQHSAMKSELQDLTRQLEKCKQEKCSLQERLHNSVTEYEIQKSKLELDTTVLRQKLDVMSSRNEILNNEMLRLEKIAALKNDDVIELENSKRDLNRKIDQLQMELLSWKSHASRADDSLLVGETENSPVIISDSEGIAPKERKTYSSAASSGIDVTQYSGTSTSDHQRTSGTESATSSLAARELPPSNGNNASTNNQQRSATESAASNTGIRSSQTNNNEATHSRNMKETVLLIGTSNVRYLSARYIAGEKYYVRKIIKYTVSEAHEYIQSLESKDNVSKFLLHLSCNDIKTLSATEHATAYCDLAKLIKEKYPSAQVTVSLGLPCKDPKIYNKIEVANAMIKERLFRVPGISLCDNSNLSYRGRPARGMLEEDGVHISRQGVFAMNNNMRSCVYKFGGESEPRRFQSRGGNYVGFGRRRATGYNAGFGNDRSRR